MLGSFGSIFAGNSDLSSESARSRHRYRRAALTSGSALMAKVVSLAVSFITVPLTLKYLGTERFGVWMTVSSLIATFSFADLGMSNGLINVVAEATGREDRQGIRQAVASAFWVLVVIAIVILFGVAVLYRVLPWANIFNVHSRLAITEAAPTCVAMLACLALSLPAATAASLQNGQQRGLTVNLWTLLGSLGSLLAVLLAIHLRAGLPILIVAIYGSTVFAGILNAAKTFLRDQRWLLPRLSAFSKPAAMLLLRTGLMFFCLQVAAALGYQSDNLVIAHYLGAAHVGSYAVPSRLFNVVPFLIGIASAPMWPAYADALSRGDVQWIRMTFRRTVLGVGLGSLFVTTMMVVFSRSILDVWVGADFQVPRLLLFGFGLRCLLSSYLQPLSFLLNGIGRLKEQAFLALLMAFFNLGLSIVLVKRIGVVGAIAGTVISEIVVVLIPQTLLAHRALRRLAVPQTAYGG